MAYFTKEAVEFIPTGAAVIDCALGGGWAQSRLINIQGVKGAGKTLLTLEAAANFIRKYKELAKVMFIDSECAFDLDYISSLGVPVEQFIFPDGIFTVEDYFNHLTKFKNELGSKEFGLCILDSLDSLSDEAEKERLIDESTYGGNKAKQISAILRRINSEISHKNITNIVISQLRDKLNSPFPMQVASGGRALAYYSSQVVRLNSKEKEKRTVKGVERIVGLNVNMVAIYNKVGMPFRDCDFRMLFGYGIDDLISNLEWLASKGPVSFGGLDRISPLADGTKATDVKKFHDKTLELPAEDRRRIREEVGTVVTSVWNEIESLLVLKEKESNNRVTKY